MVFIVYKKGDLNKFMIQCPVTTTVDEVRKLLVTGLHLIISMDIFLTLFFNLVNNLRIKVDCLAVAIEGLAQHGPIRPEALRGLQGKETIEPALINLTAEEREKWVTMKPTGDERYA